MLNSDNDGSETKDFFFNTIEQWKYISVNLTITKNSLNSSVYMLKNYIEDYNRDQNFQSYDKKRNY